MYNLQLSGISTFVCSVLSPGAMALVNGSHPVAGASCSIVVSVPVKAHQSQTRNVGQCPT